MRVRKVHYYKKSGPNDSPFLGKAQNPKSKAKNTGSRRQERPRPRPCLSTNRKVVADDRLIQSHAMARVAGTSLSSQEEDGSVFDGTYEGNETSTMDMSGSNSRTSSAGSYYGFSLPSSFASEGTSRNGESRAIVSSLDSQSHQMQGSIELYNQDNCKDLQTSSFLPTEAIDDGASASASANSEDQLALQISKETKPMLHLLRLLKEMEDDGNLEQDPKGRARASLISDFEEEVTLIEHRIKGKHLPIEEEQPPLPPNWLALEDPTSGDIYYANEKTGEIHAICLVVQS